MNKLLKTLEYNKIAEKLTQHALTKPGQELCETIEPSWEYREISENLAQTHETKASSHFIIGIDGKIIQCVPLDEISYCSNHRNIDTIAIECCHPDDSGEERNTLLLHIKAYLCRNGEYSPEEETSFAPALCNRIDRNTGGMVIAAKNAEALREMNRIIKENLISKFYLCAVHGSVKKKADTLEGFLVKNSRDNLVTVSPTPFKGAKKIITKYKKLSEKRELSLLEIELVTGRTHQIRAHMSYIGHPLLGDGKYGINKNDRAKGYKYQALYSYRLRFLNIDGPLAYLSGKEISVPFENIWFLKEFDMEKNVK